MSPSSSNEGAPEPPGSHQHASLSRKDTIMARSMHATYTAADRYERSAARSSRRYRRHLTADAIRTSLAGA